MNRTSVTPFAFSIVRGASIVPSVFQVPPPSVVPTTVVHSSEPHGAEPSIQPVEHARRIVVERERDLIGIVAVDVVDDRHEDRPSKERSMNNQVAGVNSKLDNPGTPRPAAAKSVPMPATAPLGLA